MKHEEEMSRLKDEHKKQLKRKNERNSTFDLARDLDQIVCERDNLRELTIVEELQKYGVFMNQGDHNVSGGGDNEQCSGLLNISTQSNHELQSKISKSLRLVPDVSALLSLIEDPTLIGFIANNNSDAEFELKECLDKLRAEANGLLLSPERDRLYLIEELQLTITKNKELGTELNELREQLKQLDSSQREDLSEGYGIGDIQSPPRLRQEKKSKTSFAQLQDKARNILSTPTKNMSDNTSFLLHLIEEFCREGDKMVEDSKRDRDDLQAQIDAADKKLKDTRQFLDIQASDREAERDEFVKEIEKLKLQIREKRKGTHLIRDGFERVRANGTADPGPNATSVRV
ncbi:unnamed protein product [Hermetia illucens]|uniref:Uncharacterized protein n=1 Tax=Hermetia illucens TaxID=343691 RepID=A0A7R8YR73_HERIL|nr:unnamed protein product [Hermetia illucens]